MKATGARRIGVTHGFTDVFARRLRELDYDAFVIKTRFSDAGEEGLAVETGESAGADGMFGSTNHA